MMDPIQQSRKTPESPEPGAPESAGMVMPPDSVSGQAAAGSIEGVTTAQPEDVGAAQREAGKVSFGRQVAQLVIIPAVIVAVCMGFAYLFSQLAGAQDSIENHLLKLRQSSGTGRLSLGLQDPRYKDRWLAAYNIASMIRRIDDPKQRQHLSDELIDILHHNVAKDEQVLEAYLLMAIGQLGQPGGLDAIIDRLNPTPLAQARLGAVNAVRRWPDRYEARRAMAGLQMLTDDADAQVRTTAVVALGELTLPGDQAAIRSLRAAMEVTGSAMREAQWNAAVALARLGDAQGSGLVAALLLDRGALEQLPMIDDSGRVQQRLLNGDQIDKIIVRTLQASAAMKDPAVWDKIHQIADKDTNVTVRKTAKQALATLPADKGHP